MPQGDQYDAVIIGAGSNGLSAAVTLAQNGRSVLVLEANQTLGGACRSGALTLPGFVHDVCSAIHPFGVGSPFFQSLPLKQHGVEWIHSRVPLAHPLDDGPAVVLNQDVDATGHTFDDARDAKSYHKLITPLVKRWPKLAPEVLRPVHIPRHPLLMARFGRRAVQSAQTLSHHLFRGDRAASWFAGLAAHSGLSLDQRPSAAVALMLAVAGHAVGWPFPKGGAQALPNALASYLRSLGGEIETDHRVKTFKELPPARAYLFDVTPRQLIAICGRELPDRYLAKLEGFRYGPGAFKVDWALSSPVPWSDFTCRYAATVHLGGSDEQIAASEQAVAQGDHPRHPFVIFAQHTRFDYSRAPAGKHTAWAYCHVPNGSTFDMTERIEAQVERFAPGFRDLILQRRSLNTLQLEKTNANLVGGDVSAGAMTLNQTFSRPVRWYKPYRTPDKRIYLCSASTPPGGGVHGMCGHHAALDALRRSLR